MFKAGSIVFNNRRLTVDCIIKSLGSSGAGLRVSNSVCIPPVFILSIPGEGFESECLILAQDAQSIEVAFR